MGIKQCVICRDIVRGNEATICDHKPDGYTNVNRIIRNPFIVCCDDDECIDRYNFMYAVFNLFNK